MDCAITHFGKHGLADLKINEWQVLDKLIYYLSTSACFSKEVWWPPLVCLCGGKHHTEISSVTAISQLGKDAAPVFRDTLLDNL